jgi:Skp family chaperone for outer membrane proteins
MRKTTLHFSAILLAMLAGFAIAGPASAQSAKSAASSGGPVERIGVVDVQKILRDSSATRAIRPQLDKMKNNYQAQFKKEEDELRAADQDLERQRAILSPEAFNEKRNEFQKRANELQRKVQEARQLLDESLGNAMGIVQDRLRDVLIQVRDEHKLQLILFRSAVIAMEPRFDITDEVLKRLNQKLPSVTVKLPPRKPAEKPN